MKSFIPAMEHTTPSYQFFSEEIDFPRYSLIFLFSYSFF